MVGVVFVSQIGTPPWTQGCSSSKVSKILLEMKRDPISRD